LGDCIGRLSDQCVTTHRVMLLGSDSPSRPWANRPISKSPNAIIQSKITQSLDVSRGRSSVG
jgi:hypothetical protein